MFLVLKRSNSLWVCLFSVLNWSRSCVVVPPCPFEYIIACKRNSLKAVVIRTFAAIRLFQDFNQHLLNDWFVQVFLRS